MENCKLGITGGIGSGKSYVSAILEKYGIPVYDTDAAAKRLMQSDPSVRSGLVSLLGNDAYTVHGLNKPLLANFIFSDKQNALKVNAIVHPLVYEDFELWAIRQEGIHVVGMESAILFESGFNKYVDKVLMVSAPVEVRLERAMRRDGATRQQILDRMSSQLDDSFKISRADYVILNDGKTDVEPQVRQLTLQLL